MIAVPLQKTPNQKLSTTLAGQVCDIELATKSTGLYLSLSVAGVAVVSSAICLNNTKIIRFPQTIFRGNLAFWARDGATDPHYSGFGEKFYLAYLE